MLICRPGRIGFRLFPGGGATKSYWNEAFPKTKEAISEGCQQGQPACLKFPRGAWKVLLT